MPLQLRDPMAMTTTNHTICFLLLLITLLISPCLSGADTNVLFSDIGGGILDTGRSLLYKERYYNVLMQSDCNLCIYEPMFYWCTSTAGLGKDCQLKLQSNGELVLSGYPRYGPSTYRRVIWRSHNTSTEGGRYALVLNYDGSLGVYGPPIWSVPNSLIKPKSTTSADHSSGSLGYPVSRVESTFWVGDQAPVGTIIAYGDYKLALDETCNLTLSNDRTKEILWFTNTTDVYKYDCFLTLEKNGLLELKYRGGGGAPLWNSGVKGPKESQYVLALRPDGMLAIYGPPIWKVNVKNTVNNGENIAMVAEE